MNTCTRTITGFALAAATAVALAVPASATAVAPAATAAPAAPAPAAAQAASTSAELVDRWYGDFLGRDADAGSQYWVDRLDAGAKPSDVTWAITHSSEYHEFQVSLAYQRLLGRYPDKGAQYWVDGLNSQRFPVEWVVQNLLASPEYAKQRGGDTGAVTGWYDFLLNRWDAGSVSAGEKAYWVKRISQVGRLGALREFYYSGDAVRHRIDINYASLLNRTADSGGLSYWFAQEVESDINVQVLIANTEEYRTRDRGNDGD